MLIVLGRLIRLAESTLYTGSMNESEYSIATVIWYVQVSLGWFIRVCVCVCVCVCACMCVCVCLHVLSEYIVSDFCL